MPTNKIKLEKLHDIKNDIQICKLKISPIKLPKKP